MRRNSSRSKAKNCTQHSQATCSQALKASKAYVLISILLLPFLLTSCGSVAGQDLTHGVRRLAVKETDIRRTDAFNDSLNGFSISLFQRHSSMNKRGNLLLSPLSAYLALGMVRNGATGKTGAEMDAAFQAEAVSVDERNLGIQAMLDVLKPSSGAFPKGILADRTADWSIANSIWADSSFKMEKEFLQKSVTHFHADVRSIDLSNPDTPDVINGWIKEKTGGRIPEVIDSIDPTVDMILANAVWFRGKWAFPFPVGSTPSVFYTPDGYVQAPFMRDSQDLDVFKGRDCSGILLPYTDLRFTFLAVLPDKNVTPRKLIDAMTAESLSEWVQSKSTMKINLEMPKFEVKDKIGLIPLLQSLGMNAIFDPSSAELRNAGTSSKGNGYLSKVIQKTYCRVDEEGTEAAAVTTIESGSAAVEEKPQTLVFDRPFLYAILETEHNTPLFLGIMENPLD